jgi:DNA-directed RNA polymerase subunit E'/Rpb7
METFKNDWWVHLLVRVGEKRHVVSGEVQATDERGVRITLVDFLVGLACQQDMFVPWSAIELAEVYTDEHSKGTFGEDQTRFERKFIGERPEKP